MLDRGNQSGLLLFTVGPVRCVADALRVAAVIPPAPLSHLPGDRDSAGFFRHGNRLVRLIDLRERFGLDPADSMRQRIIVVDRDGGALGYRVDRVDNVIDRSEGRFGPTPRYVPRDAFPGTFTRNNRLHLYVDLDRLWRLQSSHWIQASGLFPELEATTPASEPVSVPASAPTSHGPAVPDKPRGVTRAPSRVPQTRDTPVDEAPSTDGPDAPSSTTPRPTMPPGGSATTRPAPSPPRYTPATRTRPARPTAGRPTPPTVSRPAGSRSAQGAPTAPATARAASPVSGSSVHEASVPVSSPHGASTGPASAPVSQASARVTPAQVDRAPAAVDVPSEQRSATGSIVLGGALLLLLGLGVWLVLGLDSGVPEGEWVRTPVDRPDEVSPGSVSVAPAPDIGHANGAAPEPPAPPQPGVAGAPVAILDGGAESVAGASSEQDIGDGESHSPLTREGTLVTLILEEPLDGLGEPAAAQGAALPESVVEAAPDATDEAETAGPAMHEGREVKREIVHVVVRGDTLWAIAERYLDDPYRYPELARLSGIRDPDLIYPGDRVRILILGRPAP